MTTSDDRTRGWYHGRFQELTAQECFELLAHAAVGRVAFCTDEGPVVLPVNFRMSGDDVVFRTAPHNSIARHLDGGPAAFQVDEVDEFTQSGWSVLVRGTGEYVESAHELPDEARPAPWPAGTRSLFIRIRARSVTGRRLYPS